jgi:hypothetical protein
MPGEIAEAVEADGKYFTARFVNIIRDLAKWRRNWKRDRDTAACILRRASQGQHPFASDEVAEWTPIPDEDPVENPPPYEPLEQGALEWWIDCDKILRWTKEACHLPDEFWYGEGGSGKNKLISS